MTDKITIETDSHIMRIGLCRPAKKNALDLDMLIGLSAAYTQLSASADLRCGVLYGHGDVFSAGMDLANVLPRLVADGAGAYLADGQVDPFGLFGPRCAKPVIVAVHGRCYTAGLELTLAADLCIAASDTIFAQQEVTRGIFPFGGGTFRLPEVVGWHNAMKAILAGDKFTAEDGYRMGLVQAVTEPGAQLDAAVALAQRVAGNAPLAVQAALRNARIYRAEGAAAALSHLTESGRTIAQSQDAREGMMSLMQRRPAVFKGE